ncbi:MBL fold metallo-hydrolase [Thalassotalea euphylliae]|uniref:MBL fold metallo-hydrolase n=1 Tax=Thalassotalea euphylliae TaxID=1655234 RepID=UPI0036368ED6
MNVFTRVGLMIFITLASLSANAEPQAWLEKVTQHQWYSGAKKCGKPVIEPIEILKVNESTYILRQNKCQHFEAPFMYLLMGKYKALLLDTGAVDDASEFPLYETVRALVDDYAKQRNKTTYGLVVVHSHSHSDHRAADEQFEGKPHVEVVAPNAEAVANFFAFDEQGNSALDLGKRMLSIVHIPGHQDESIAIYDPKTQWLLTGDTVYPGRLYVRDWQQFSKSIQRLVDFTRDKTVSAVMGTHIEMSATPGVDYPMGSQFQPQEHPLPLSPSILQEISDTLTTIGDKPQRKVLTSVIIYPVEPPSIWQRIAAWFM